MVITVMMITIANLHKSLNSQQVFLHIYLKIGVESAKFIKNTTREPETGK